MQRAFIVLVVLFMSLVACGREPQPGHLSGRGSSSHGDFPDNQLLAHVPEDTPYAFASFEPVPLELFEQMGAMYKPIFERGLQDQTEEGARLRALVDEIGTFSVKRIEELGFSSKARVVLYGIGVYPVFRIEVRDGNAVFGFVQRVAKLWNYTLPAPREEKGRKVWRIDDDKASVLISVAASELVFAIAPSAVLDKYGPMILGDRKPAKSLSTRLFRDIARRHGYGPNAIGFLELPRLVTSIVAIAGSDAPPPACTSAIVSFAKRAPRVTFGYDELSRKRMSGGMVLELAPDVLAKAKTLSTNIGGLDRLKGQRPLFALAAGADLVQARNLATAAMDTVRSLASACSSNELAQMVSKVEVALSGPLPPYLEGMKGGVGALTALEVLPDGTKKIEGWGVVHMADSNPILAMAANMLPGLALKPDGVAQALPAELGMPGSIAANRQAITVAVGTGSERTAIDLLQATPSHAPLMLFQMDIARFFEGLRAMGEEESEEDQMTREMMKLYGPIMFSIDVDDRGIVGWSQIDLK